MAGGLPIPNPLNALLGIPGEIIQPAGTITDSAKQAIDITKATTKAAAWLSNRSNWIRVLKVVAGVGLILVALSETSVAARAQSSAAILAKVVK
jgi:hypothetical protein